MNEGNGVHFLCILLLSSEVWLSLWTYYYTSFAIISPSVCQIWSNQEGLQLKLIIVLPLAWAERELKQGWILWTMVWKILVIWEVKNDSIFVLVAWGKMLVCKGCCQKLQRCQCCYHSVLQSLIQQLLEPRSCCRDFSPLWVMFWVPQEVWFFKEAFLYPKFNTEWRK